MSSRISHTKLEQMDRTWLTCDEVALVLRVQPCTIRWWTRLGCPFEPAGRLRFYDVEKVKQWLREREAQRQAARVSRGRRHAA